MSDLLDTCIVSELVKNRPRREVVQWVNRQDETNLHLSVITLGEVRKGIARLAPSRRRQALEDWLEHDLRGRFRGRILDVNASVADQWGLISARCEQAGRTVPVLDALIAATAVVWNLRVVTRNTPHMQATGVRLLDPWEG